MMPDETDARKTLTAWRIGGDHWDVFVLHYVPKKEATKLLAITFSNLNRFSKFFHC